MSATTGPGTMRWSRRSAPAFEKATGIKIDFTLLPVDPWRARLRAELGAGSSGIDIAQWSVGMAGWMAPHHGGPRAPAGADQVDAIPTFDWNDYLAGTKKAATYDGKLCGHPVPHHHRHLPLSEGAAGTGRLQQAARHLGRSS